LSSSETGAPLVRMDWVGALAAVWMRMPDRVLATGRDRRVRVQSRAETAALDAAMDRYAAGDDAGFAELYDGLAPRLYGYLLRQTGEHARSEDLVQQTFMKIHRARGTFIAGAAVLPWAFAIARRLLIDSARRRGREVLAPDAEDADRADARLDPDPPADELLEAEQLAKRIRAELERLPEAQRTAFQLLKEEGLSVAEAAQVLGTTVSAVKLRAHRAYVALRAVLGDLAPEEQKS
jgi:RNA polymerase sigma-70 factor (ECF subfamily)